MNINHDALATASAETLIEAPIDLVWAVQSDLERWPAWNPGVKRIEVRGPVAEGTEFHWKAGGVSITSVLREVDPPRRIGWTGKAPGLRAVHVWTFEPDGDRTHVRTAESFEGLLAKLLPGMMRRTLEKTLDRGLAALKVECERRAAG
jgi:uncharacterized protein YndB with AHSA1/START domain